MVSFSAIRAFISLIRISMEKLPTLERKGLPIWKVPWSFWQRIWKAIWIQSWTLERPKLATSQGQRKMYNPIPPLATRSLEDRTGGSQVHEGDKTYSIPPAALKGLATFMCLTQCLQWWKKFAPPHNSEPNTAGGGTKFNSLSNIFRDANKTTEGTAQALSTMS